MTLNVSDTPKTDAGSYTGSVSCKSVSGGKASCDNYALTKDLILIWWLWLIMGGLIVAIFNSFSLLSFFYVKDTYFMIEGKKDVKPDFTPRGKQ